MSKIDYIHFQARTQPLAYLLTFRCYGSWLHGEDRGSVDRRRYHRYGSPDMSANKRILTDERLTLKIDPFLLSKPQPENVQVAIEDVCEIRRYLLHAISVRTNHVHVVVSSTLAPELVMGAFKSYATRRLREANLLRRDVKPWSRHGSTRYLWSEEQLHKAIEYVNFGQGDEPFY
jgi:REP element-mobilizing transposase RayT